MPSRARVQRSSSTTSTVTDELCTGGSISNTLFFLPLQTLKSTLVKMRLLMERLTITFALFPHHVANRQNYLGHFDQFHEFVRFFVGKGNYTLKIIDCIEVVYLSLVIVCSQWIG